MSDAEENDSVELPGWLQKAHAQGDSFQSKQEEKRARDEAARAEKERLREEERLAVEEALQNVVPGELVPGQGVYLGKYVPQDRAGKSLHQIFNVFAAPEDMSDSFGVRLFTYEGALRCLDGVKNVLGHHGKAYKNDEAFYRALEDGSYDGEWVMPPMELLNGVHITDDTESLVVQADNLYTHRSRGVLRSTFARPAKYKPDDGSDTFYWSCTEGRFMPPAPGRFLSVNNLNRVWASDFAGEKAGSYYDKDGWKFNCRPVRLVPA